jgi:hypothetical protein
MGTKIRLGARESGPPGAIELAKEHNVPQKKTDKKLCNKGFGPKKKSGLLFWVSWNQKKQNKSENLILPTIKTY